MRARIRPIALLAAATAVLALPGMDATAAGGDQGKAVAAAKKKKCKQGFVLKRGKCVKRAPKAPSLKPIDYTKVAGLSQPTYKPEDITTESLMLPMPDGISVYLEITRPKAPGKYPIIMEASGYHGTLYQRDGIRILPVPKDKEGNPLGLKGYFPPRGYAVLMMDLRGTGRSQGCLDHLGPNDKQDEKAVIEWATSQPWSNGKLGITGHSYVGGTTNLAAASGAKGLATIVPSASLARMYDHQFQAGVPYNLQWLGPIAAYEGLAIDRHLPPGLPQDPIGLVIGGETGDNFGKDMQYFGCGYQNSAITAGPGEYTGQVEKWHRDRDFSQEARKSPVPIFLVHGVLDEAARVAGIDWFLARGKDGGHKDDKLWLGPWDHGIGCCPNQRGIQWTYALHAWFDKWLMGRNVDTGPPIEIFLNDSADDLDAVASRKQEATFASWPPPTKDLVLGTGGGGTLLFGKDGEPGSLSYTADPRGYAQGNDGTAGVDFVSEPVTSDVLMIGEPKLDLVVSATQPQLDLIANLFAEDSSGSRRRVTQCAMNIALRDGLDTFSPAVPLQQYTVNPPCFAMAYKLRKGSKLVLRVTSSDPDKVPFHAVDPQVSVFGGSGGTKMTVPVVEKPTLYPDTVPLGQRGDSGAGA